MIDGGWLALLTKSEQAVLMVMWAKAENATGRFTGGPKAIGTLAGRHTIKTRCTNENGEPDEVSRRVGGLDETAVKRGLTGLKTKGIIQLLSGGSSAADQPVWQLVIVESVTDTDKKGAHGVRPCETHGVQGVPPLPLIKGAHGVPPCDNEGGTPCTATGLMVTSNGVQGAPPKRTGNGTDGGRLDAAAAVEDIDAAVRDGSIADADLAKIMRGTPISTIREDPTIRAEAVRRLRRRQLQKAGAAA